MESVTTHKLLERLRLADAAWDRHESGSPMWMQAQDLAEDAHRAYLERIEEINAGKRPGRRRTR